MSDLHPSAIHNARLGGLGEARAAGFLQGLGWRVLDSRWRCRYGELDLVCLDGETVVFVEVKARGSARFGTPEEAVTFGKRSRLVYSALRYLRDKRLEERPSRFDVVAVDGAGLRHIKDAFGADGLCR